MSIIFYDLDSGKNKNLTQVYRSMHFFLNKNHLSVNNNFIIGFVHLEVFMDQHALEYYRSYSDETPYAHFHRVIALHEEPMLDWNEVIEIAPNLPKGWYELAQLSPQDRIEFVRDFWCTKFAVHPPFVDFIINFFKSIDDIGIYLTQQKYDDPFSSQLVYSLSDNSGFFHGGPPSTEYEIINLQKAFQDYILPADYIDFLRIHDGFAKLTDTGISRSSDMQGNYENLQEVLEKGDPLRASSGISANPKSLIPFYKSFDMPFYQCFWGEWYPEQEMGNVYYSGLTHTISDYATLGAGVESMAFETFTDWLMFYLEKID